MEGKKDIVFIVNPHSGTSEKREMPALIDAKVDRRRFNHKVMVTEFQGHAAQVAKECAAKGTDIVVAVGGDGTVNEVARSIVHSQTALGIIPSGSGNGLARHLCIPLDPKKAMDIINNCDIEALDYGVVNGLPFFCTCGMGFDAFISQKFAEAGKRGPMTYLEQILKEGLNYKPETYEVEDETGAWKFKAFLITCANASQYGNNAYIAPHATMTDGLMDVTIMEPFTAFEVPQLSIDILNKTLDKNSKIKSFKTNRIKIKRHTPGPIHYDGDPTMTEADIDVHIEKRGIRIITNPEETEDGSQPSPILSAFSELLANLNTVREDLEESRKKFQEKNKEFLKRLTGDQSRTNN